MAGNSAFRLVDERGWRRGLDNLMRVGFASWWRTSTWYVHALIWTAVINAMLAGILWGAANQAETLDAPHLFGVFVGLFPAVAVIIIMQGAIVGEKQAGTAAWVLSKPVSRTSFIVSKLVPNAVGFLVTMILCPGILAFVQLALASQGGPSLGRFLLGLAILWLHLLFYLSLTVMLGALFDQWGAVIAIPLGLLFGQQYIMGLIPTLGHLLPWSLVVMFPDSESSLVSMIMHGQQPPTYAPLIFVLVCTVIFTAVALWAFDRQEF